MNHKGASATKYVGERIDGASIRIHDGRVFTHDTHYDAICDAFALGAFPEFATSPDEFYEAAKADEIFQQFGVECGFVTTTGRFVNREEAHQIAVVSNQVRACEPLSESDFLCAESLISM